MRPVLPDPKLLAVLAAVLRRRSLAAAAIELGLSLPAIVRALAELRRVVGDPVVLRTAAGLAPTAQAARLAAGAREVFDAMRDRIAPVERFDPAVSERIFRIAMSEAAAISVAPPLARALRRSAPRARLYVEREPGKPDDVATALAHGELDLALTTAGPVAAGLRRATLASEPFVALRRSRGARVKFKLTVAQFRAARHLSIAGAFEPVERLIASKVPSSRVTAQVPGIAAALATAAAGDAIVIVPAAVAATLGRALGLATAALPFPIAPAETRMVWHAERHRDPGHVWLRETLARLADDR